MQGFFVSSDQKNLNFETIYGFISQSYWAKGIPRATMQKAIENSLVFGVYTDAGEQVGFARVTTDKATFAYLADVFVMDSHRGLGLGRLLMNSIVEHPDMQGLRRFMLATRDAHGLYAKYGFEPVGESPSLMQICIPDIYSQATN
ncbi:GNAT family N-acetyltransferase [Lacimicrobium sp. SS2-24]|uniref:GNAT family N-acetyltransferase n=1 Tax=Lacimicrobium sp. SS2-24 TaxID=2005569 RepID=UPI000B4B6FA9|nr:GNAT family N-acetyltransferase [Lacimicrobium sp. SS2-24]